MGNIKSLLVLGLASVAMAAHADSFTFSYKSASIDAWGTLVGTDNGGGIFTIGSGTLNVNSDTTGTISGSYSLIPGSSGNFGGFSYDSQLFYGSDPQLDSNGLLFGAGSQLVNIWGNAPGNYSLAALQPDGSAGALYSNPDAGVFQAVPEPASMAVLGLGAVGLIRRRKKA